MADDAQVVLLAPLLERLEQVAPHVVLDVTFRADAMDEVLRAVREGRCDLSVGPPIETSGAVTQTLFTDENVCVVRRGHPFARRPTLKAWASSLLRGAA